MIHKLLSFLVFVVCSLSVMSQPMIGHYLSETRETNRGRKFQVVEEYHEVLISGVTGVPHKVIKKFSPTGLKTSQTAYGKEGGISSEFTWEYNSSDRLISKRHKYFVNMIGWREEIVRVNYNAQTGVPESISMDREGKPFQKASIIVDTLGKVEMVQVFNNVGALSFIERLIYLQPANMIRVLVYKTNNQFVGTWSYPMDPNKEFSISTVNQVFYPNGDVRIETLTDATKGDQAYYYEYEYDSQGNWITKETYQVKLGKGNKVSKKKIEHRITRKITYY